MTKKKIELTHKNTKTDIINIFHMFRKVKENTHYEKRNGRYIKKRQKLNS